MEERTLSNEWQLAEDSILLKIFSYLGARDAISITEVCQNWYRVGKDEFLWKMLFREKWNISGPLAPGKKSWLSEYKRLSYNAPLEEYEVLNQGEDDHVFHVSFSNDGNMFSSCSTDGIKVWNSKYPATLRFSVDTCEYNWKYAQFSQFNKKDTVLLVCGKKYSITRGEIITFDVENGFTLMNMVPNEPYGFCSAWYGDDCFLSSQSAWFDRGIPVTTIWTNNVNKPEIKKMYRFYHKNPTVVCSVMTAKFLRDTGRTESYLIFITGSQFDIPHVIGLKKIDLPKRSSVVWRNGEVFDVIDHSIDMKANILGMALSPDEKYLYLNTLPWPEDLDAPYQEPADRGIVIRVLDLGNLRIMGSTLTSHESLMYDDFIFLDVCSEYVTSGSEEECAYLWDRSYRNRLTRLPHDDRVNCAVFNPMDSEMLITASDDCSIKIWYSRNRRKEIETEALHRNAEKPVDFELDDELNILFTLS